MKKITMGALVLTFALSPFTSRAEHHEAAGAGADPMAMMQEMMTPGPHHEMMAHAAGDWTYTSKMWMDPAAPPIESSGTAHMEMIMNGLFLTEDVQGDMMGMSWMGHGTYGFDKSKNKHIGVWYDSFGSLIMQFEGDCEDHCRKITMVSDFIDPMSGEPARMKIVTSRADENHSLNDMYMVVDGADVKMGEIRYTRKM